MDTTAAEQPQLADQADHDPDAVRDSLVAKIAQDREQVIAAVYALLSGEGPSKLQGIDLIDPTWPRRFTQLREALLGSVDAIRKTTRGLAFAQGQVTGFPEKPRPSGRRGRGGAA